MAIEMQASCQLLAFAAAAKNRKESISLGKYRARRFGADAADEAQTP
jgi:hypothetical protein